MVLGATHHQGFVGEEVLQRRLSTHQEDDEPRQRNASYLGRRSKSPARGKSPPSRARSPGPAARAQSPNFMRSRSLSTGSKPSSPASSSHQGTMWSMRPAGERRASSGDVNADVVFPPANSRPNSQRNSMTSFKNTEAVRKPVHANATHSASSVFRVKSFTDGDPDDFNAPRSLNDEDHTRYLYADEDDQEATAHCNRAWLYSQRTEIALFQSLPCAFCAVSLYVPM